MPIQFARRFALFYVVAYAAPFPLKWIPGLEAIVGLCTAPWTWLVTWVGDVVFGVEAVQRFNGSGDTVYHWVEAGCLLTLAALAALAWWRPPSPRAMDRVRAYAGLFLGATMMVYGWVKLLPVQFQPPGPARLIMPLGDLAPGELMWSFMGTSTGYQVALGLVEMIAGTLLFWRRTALLGALISLGVMANVLAMNLGYDVPVKLFSAHLLLFALFVAAPDLGRLADLLCFGRPARARVADPFPIASKAGRRLRTAGKVGLILLIAYVQVVTEVLPFLAWSPSPFYGVYRVESFAQSGRVGDAVPEAQRWVRVGIDNFGLATIVTADGRGQSFSLAFDRDKATMRWARQEGAPFVVSYEEQEPGVLRVRGEVDGRATEGLLRPDERRFELIEHETHLVFEGRR